MINNSVLDESLGVVNGLGQSLASLARMVGPGFGGMLWSISTEVITFHLFDEAKRCYLTSLMLAHYENSLELKSITEIIHRQSIIIFYFDIF